jgi:hypothetical protein
MFSYGMFNGDEYFCFEKFQEFSEADVHLKLIKLKFFENHAINLL